MELEALALQRVIKLERELESARCESLDWVAELLTADRATAAERGLEAAKVCQVETEVAL